MKSVVEKYFLFFLKPSMMILTFVCNYFYLRHSSYPNDFYFYIYVITFFLKPFFYFIILLGLMMNYKIKTFSDTIITILIVIGIYFGFPIKEYSDYFSVENLKQILSDVGREYLLDEYMTTHYVVNIFIENIPIIVFVLINNFMIESKFPKMTLIDPILTNICFIFLNGAVILLFYLHKISI